MRIIPRDALESAFFESVPETESLDAVFTFEAPLVRTHALSRAFGGRDDQKTVAQAVDDWASRAVPQKAMSKDSDSTTWRIGIVGVDEPRSAMRSLIDAVDKTGVGVRDVVFLRRRIDESGVAGSAVGDPRMLATEEVASEDEFWEASFDASLVPPPVEDPRGMLSTIRTDDGTIATELRVPLYVPDVRVAYGLADVDDRPRDSRVKRLSRRIAAALRSSFGGDAPDFYDREGRARSVDCIARSGRQGYAFAFQREDLLARMVGCFRYREYELLMAVREVVFAEKLAPVVHWLRDSVYIVNLWR